MSRRGPLSLKPFLISLLHEMYDDKQKNLQMSDLTALAAEYSMRLDDVVSTLIELTNEGGWSYQDKNGQSLEMDSDLLGSEARLSQEDLKKFSGSWQPAV